MEHFHVSERLFNSPRNSTPKTSFFVFLKNLVGSKLGFYCPRFLLLTKKFRNKKIYCCNGVIYCFGISTGRVIKFHKRGKDFRVPKGTQNLINGPPSTPNKEQTRQHSSHPRCHRPLTPQLYP